MVAILLQFIAVLINITLFFPTILKLKYKLKINYVILLIFQIVFVFPVILEWIFGVQDYSYKSPGFNKALNDEVTNIYYSLFIIIISIGLFLIGKLKSNKGVEIKDLKVSFSSFKINREFYILLAIMMFIPVILILFSPSPEKYIMEYAYFQKHAGVVEYSEMWYHKNVMRIGGLISLLSIITVKLFSRNNITNNFLIYTAAILTGIINGKRTLFAFIILGIVIADILKAPRGKFPIKKLLLAVTSIIFVFILYAYVIDKHTVNVSTLDNLRLYFFRDVDVKYAIFALLNSADYEILEYRGQSYIYNLLFYVPRAFWADKPYPYDVYVTATALGYPPETVLSWSFQTSIFGEAISNFGWLGIPFCLLMISLFIKVSEKSENPLIILLSIFILVFSFMNHFGSFSYYFILWLLLVLLIRTKKGRKNTSKCNRDYSRMT